MGVMSWRESDEYENKAKKKVKTWGATFWSLWKGVAEGTSTNALNSSEDVGLLETAEGRDWQTIPFINHNLHVVFQIIEHTCMPMA